MMSRRSPGNPGGSGAGAMESFALLSISGAPVPSSARRSSPEALCPPGLPGIPKAAGAGMDSAGPGRPSLPPCRCGVAPDGSAGAPACALADPPGAELPAHNCTVYRPWFSPYSYFVRARGAARRDAGGRSASPASSTWEPDKPDDLSEVVCSSSCSLDEPQPPASAGPARSAAGAGDSVTVQDILAASQWQLAPRDGYKCVACCRVFPTLCSLKTHIRHGAREGFSCKVYYRRLKALWEKERRAQEALDAAAPL